MKTKGHQPRFDDDKTRLAGDCLAHLEEEEAFLEATRNSLQSLRTELIRGRLPELTQALEVQEGLSQIGAELELRRLRVQEELAHSLGTSRSEATILRFADYIQGEMGDRLRDRRIRVRALAQEIDEINRSNALLAGHCAGLLQELLIEITGTSGGGQRYGHIGVYQEPFCGSLLSAQG